MILYLPESSVRQLHIFFSRPQESSAIPREENGTYRVFHPHQGIPAKADANHFRFPICKVGFYQRMIDFLKLVAYGFSDWSVKVHFGWPVSSWSDRFA
jgi:hypothetical protein